MISVVPLPTGMTRPVVVTRATLAIGHLVLDIAAQVLEAVAGQGGGDDDLLRVVHAFEGDFLRRSGERGHLGGLGQNDIVGLERVLVVDVAGGERAAQDEGR